MRAKQQPNTHSPEVILANTQQNIENPDSTLDILTHYLSYTLPDQIEKSHFSPEQMQRLEEMLSRYTGYLQEINFRRPLSMVHCAYLMDRILKLITWNSCIKAGWIVLRLRNHQIFKILENQSLPSEIEQTCRMQYEKQKQQAHQRKTRSQQFSWITLFRKEKPQELTQLSPAKPTKQIIRNQKL